MHKKGLEANIVVALIITLVAGAIVLYFISAASCTTTLAAKKTVCEISVLARFAMGAVPTASRETLDLECGTVYASVSDKGIFEGTAGMKGCPVKTFSKTELSDNDKLTEIIAAEIADKMAECWEQVGEGKLDFTSNWDGDRRCMPCSTIEFSKEIKDKNLVIKDFYGFLQETKMQKSGKTYYEYLTNGRFGRDLSTQTPINYPIDRSYSIMFIYDKVSNWWLISGGVIAVAGVIVAGPIIGVAAAVGSSISLVSGTYIAEKVAQTTQQVKTVSIVPTDRIEAVECEMLY